MKTVNNVSDQASLCLDDVNRIGINTESRKLFQILTTREQNFFLNYNGLHFCNLHLFPLVVFSVLKLFYRSSDVIIRVYHFENFYHVTA